MFIISAANPLGYGAAQTMMNNVRDIYDIVFDITGNKKEALWAMETASDMGIGGQYERGRYFMECVENEKDSIWK